MPSVGFFLLCTLVEQCVVVFYGPSNTFTISMLTFAIIGRDRKPPDERCFAISHRTER